MGDPSVHIRDQSIAALRKAAARLNDARQSELSESLDTLANEVDQPCVIAIVGRMKAGKSSFLNALLQNDLAKVGVNETTATINRFVYGNSDAECPVRCHWRDGRVTSESREFLDCLQGNDSQTIRRATEIQYLEYALPNERLRDTVLVDTPGMCTTVEEHKERTAEFLQLARQLGNEHTKRTQELGSQADAVIYLVGEVGRQTDQAFLEEFQTVTGGRSSAINAVGVMAKIDLQQELMDRRRELSERLAAQLSDCLNTVVPVSAGLRRALDRMEMRDLPSLATYVSELRLIPPVRLEKMLSNEEFYRTLEPDDCPVTIDQREQLLADLPWRVFTTIAGICAASDKSVDVVSSELGGLAGFDALLDVLDRNLFRRSRVLHAFHIVQKAIVIVERLRFQPMAEARSHDRDMRARRDRFLKFVRSANTVDPEVASELVAFLDAYGPRTNHESRLTAAYTDTAGELAALRQRLNEFDEDLQALKLLERIADDFTPAERDELRALFGVYGDEVMRRANGQGLRELGQRQRYWRKVIRPYQPQAYRLVAERAVNRYGILISAKKQDESNAGDSKELN